mmetsp:Transcript_89661/g.187274  ORF Transcript_89661/g.187274 Transcript_89661/m.187274 type:complete len:95 (-) Transcript_89661:654-938(-)
MASSELQHCALCNLQKATLLKCSRCRRIVYCSAECQRADWKSHRLACSLQVAVPAAGSSSASSAKPSIKSSGAAKSLGKACWGGELRPQDSRES